MFAICIDLLLCCCALDVTLFASAVNKVLILTRLAHGLTVFDLIAVVDCLFIVLRGQWLEQCLFWPAVVLSA